MPLDPATCPIVPGQEMIIEISKGRSGLGLSIVGGKDTPLVSHLMVAFLYCKFGILKMEKKKKTSIKLHVFSVALAPPNLLVSMFPGSDISKLSQCWACELKRIRAGKQLVGG